MDWSTVLDPLGTVALAGLFGGIVGLEREVARKPAGLRTHVFVAANAAFLMLLGEVSIAAYGDLSSVNTIRADPTRVIQAIVVGISFLGAGTILRTEAKHVEGLTTAASILLTAAIGIAVGIRQTWLAFGVSVLVVVVLFVVGNIERAIERRADR